MALALRIVNPLHRVQMSIFVVRLNDYLRHNNLPFQQLPNRFEKSNLASASAPSDNWLFPKLGLVLKPFHLCFYVFNRCPQSIDGGLSWNPIVVTGYIFGGCFKSLAAEMHRDLKVSDAFP